MKVLAFDVGIKNLAYCMINIDNVNSSTNVYDSFYVDELSKYWNKINLIETVPKVCACSTQCTNPITKYCVINMEKYYLCTKHKKFHTELLKRKQEEFILINESSEKVKCCHTPSCKTKSKWKHGTVPICDKHKLQRERVINEASNLIKYESKVNSLTIHEIKLVLLEELEKKADVFLEADYVAIENQPTFDNPTMKAISDVLYTWFLMRGVIDRRKFGLSELGQVTFVSPSSKLMVDGMTSMIRERISKAENEYNETKDVGEHVCKILCSGHQEYIEHINSFAPKKDDICDACLHAIKYAIRVIDKIVNPPKPKLVIPDAVIGNSNAATSL